MTQTHDIKLEKRELFIPGCLSVREAEGEKAQEAIEGVAIVCNKETVLYECNDFREVEVIDPSCINEEFLREQDITLNALHERQLTFGRTGGNLTIESREDGLAFRCTGTSDKFRETRALINDGVYTGCSFEFFPKDYTVTEREGADGKTEYVIRHTGFESINALTVAMNPAYKQTSVNAREIYNSLHQADDEAAKREAEAKAKAEADAKAEAEARERADRKAQRVDDLMREAQYKQLFV